MVIFRKIIGSLSYLFGNTVRRTSEATSMRQRKKELNLTVKKLNAWYRKHNAVITGSDLPYARSEELVVRATNSVTSESAREGIIGLLGIAIEVERNQDIFQLVNA